MRLGLGIEQSVYRLPRKMRTKGAICVARTELLPAQLLQLTEKTGEAQEHRYAKTLLSSPSMEGPAAVSS